MHHSSSQHQFQDQEWYNPSSSNILWKIGRDPHIHIKEFFAVCTTITNRGENDEEIHLRLFPFSLKDKAKEWLYSLPSGSITSWVDLTAKFLSKLFPAHCTNKIRKEIMGVQQLDGEPFHEYWECYQRLLNSCLHHGIDQHYLGQNYNYNCGQQDEYLHCCDF
ncbi:hypothetical protein Dsin_022103 [Dipteronia sinensis]|uniref:Retrotransposon gag domain-containing protein n=1 Tax=Dipteronia sinensis TaxID=43782 RepID=A0AAE0A0T6_9ROSI|nr:hypothetical protein Dsin_022103 [Dipteronia sinensis]